jgi:polyisoprenoid-binding protein YceI
MKHRIALVPAIFSLVIPAFAAEKTFTVVGDRLEYRNLATVESETEYEAFTGKTTKVSGTVKFDPAKKSGAAMLLIDVASVNTGIPTRDEHMRSAQWMDAGQYPNIKLETKSVKHAGGDNYNVTGMLTMHGVTREVKFKATVRYRPASELNKSNGFDGDVVQVKGKFDVKLSDFGVKIPAPAANKVSNTVTLGISAYAVAK